MPGYKVNVCDIGLKLQDALDLGLALEKGTRKKAYPQELKLTALEKKCFEGERKGNSWLYQRVELNAFTAPDLIEYVENQLRANGVRGKVIPADEHLPQLAEPLVHKLVENHVEGVILHLVSADGIACKIAEGILETHSLDQARQWIEEGFAANLESAWDVVLVNRLRGVIGEESKKIKAKVLKELKRAVGGKAGRGRRPANKGKKKTGER
jgi:hypothetical protein